MKKIIITAAFLVFSTISAKAVDLGFFSLTAGLASNNSVWGASATQEKFNELGTASTGVLNESGVFTESYSSQFIELGLGEWISLGYEHTPDSISTPNIITNEGNADQNSIRVDFNDVNTAYLKINTPWGLYVKAGSVETNVDIKEVMGSGNTYQNMSTQGSSVGAGYQKYIGESGFGLRIEANYTELDKISTNNGVTKVGANPGANAATGGRNEVSAKNLEGLSAKLAVTYTLGRNN